MTIELAKDLDDFQVDPAALFDFGNLHADIDCGGEPQSAASKPERLHGAIGHIAPCKRPWWFMTRTRISEFFHH